jgi:hypothetical protein
MIGVFGHTKVSIKLCHFVRNKRLQKVIVFSHEKYYTNSIENLIIRTIDRPMLFGISVRILTTYFYCRVI